MTLDDFFVDFLYGRILKRIQNQSMQINCYLSPGCTAEPGLRKNISQALFLSNVEASVQFYRIEDEEAVARGLSGSPSIFINEKELQPQQSIGFA